MKNRKGLVLWSLPLRLYVGFFWLLEGLKKFAGEENYAAKKFFSVGEDSWLKSDSVKMPFEWLQSADAASGASAAAEGGEAATEFATPILSEMPGWFQFIMELMLPNAGVALFMQKMMVFIEMAIGLALIFGLFTWIASVASAGFIAMFVLCAMLGWDQFWVLFASLALLNGAGRVLGLDQFVVPFFQKKAGNEKWYGKILQKAA